jgi:hypothetical protein
MGADRSLIFTALLEEPEFGAMEDSRAQRLLSDAQERLDGDRQAKPGITTEQSMRDYVNDVTNGHTTEPGIWERYVDALLAGDEVRAQQAGITLPPGMHVVGPLDGSSHR